MNRSDLSIYLSIFHFSLSIASRLVVALDVLYGTSSSEIHTYILPIYNLISRREIPKTRIARRARILPTPQILLNGAISKSIAVGRSRGVSSREIQHYISVFLFYMLIRK